MVSSIINVDIVLHMRLHVREAFQLFQKLRALLCRSRELIAYLLFGFLTTVVNYLVYYPCYNLLNLGAGSSNVIAWLVSVCVAFVTNKAFVFKSDEWSGVTVWKEALSFVGGRAASGVIETAALVILVDNLGWNGNLMKVLLSVIVLICNYVISKWLVFRKK